MSTKTLAFCLLSIAILCLSSCKKEEIEGCTDPASINYNPDAVIDNGSCAYRGCTDPEAVNYDPQANSEDNSCIYAGCTNPLADNYDPRATIDDGTCIIPTVDQRLARGEKPFDIVDLGIPVDSLHRKFYEGGFIFYLDVNTRTGLVAAAQDLTDKAPWGCEGTRITSGNEAKGRAKGTGKANTEAILTDCKEAGIAARLCDEATIEGKSDWFLPSKDEVTLMYSRLARVAPLSGDYWTSTVAEYDSFEPDWIKDAATVIFSWGTSFYETRKGFSRKVRPVREF